MTPVRQFPWGTFNLTWAIFWACNLPVVSYLFFFERVTWDKIAVFYLVVVSLWANFATHLTGYRADRPNA